MESNKVTAPMDQALDAWVDKGARLAVEYGLSSLKATVITDEADKPYLHWRATDMQGLSKTGTRSWGGE